MTEQEKYFFDHGYAQAKRDYGKVIEDIKANVKKFGSDCEFAVAGDNEDCLKCVECMCDSFNHIIDKHIGKENE